MNVRGVYVVPTFIACPYAPCLGVYTPRDECWRGIHPPNIYPVPIPLANSSISLAMNVGGVYTLPTFITCIIPIVEGSTRLAMNIGGVYTLPIFIACPDTSYRGHYAPRDERWRVYTLAIFIVCPYTPCRVVYTPQDECFGGVHHSNIHCKGDRPLDTGYTGTR